MSFGIGEVVDGLDRARADELLGQLVVILRLPGPNGSGGGVVRGHVIAIAQDGARWDEPASLVISADGNIRRAGLVPLDAVIELGIEAGA